MATVEAVDESIIDAMVAAETMTGDHGRTVDAIDREWLVEQAVKG